MTEDNAVLGETGIVGRGEYVQYIDMKKSISGNRVKIKVMFYEPEIYYSRGSVAPETVISE